MGGARKRVLFHRLEDVQRLTASRDLEGVRGDAYVFSDQSFAAYCHGQVRP